MADESTKKTQDLTLETSILDFPCPPLPSDPATDVLFSDSVRRIQKFIPLASSAIILLLLWKGTFGLAMGFVLGATVAWINFLWLKSTVAALADAITQGGMQASRPRVVLRFVTRFALIALGAYVIFESYPVAFHGFLGGLFIPVLAIFMEAAYVVLAAIRPAARSPSVAPPT